MAGCIGHCGNAGTTGVEAVSAILGLFGLIPGWLYAAAIAALMATNCTTLHRLDSAKVELSDLKAQHAEAARAAEASARSKEQAAATTLAQTEKEARDAQKRLSADLAVALDSLRKRPARPASGDVPASAGNPVGCTGAGLFAEDASAALREAARADLVRTELARCTQAYDAAVRLTK